MGDSVATKLSFVMLFNPSQIGDGSIGIETKGACPARELTPPLRQLPSRSSWVQRIPTLLLLCAAPLVVLYAFIVPPFQVPDEDAHLLRAYGMSEGDLIARQRTRIPSSFLSLAERFCPFPSHFPP